MAAVATRMPQLQITDNARMYAMTRCLFLATIAVLSLGCKAMDLNQSLPWSSAKNEQESKYVQPETMITIWNETLYTEPGKRPMRGFGGRIYFYDKNSRPIPVDGEFICYGFDDAARNGEMSSSPDRKFVFTAEQMTHHFGESDIGASYSIWLPWDELGNGRKEISLYPVFRTKGGKIVRGSTSKHLLPGKNTLSEQERRGFVVERQPRRDSWVTDQGIQRASHLDSSGPDPVDDSARRVSTFRMPSALRNAPAGSTRSLTNRAIRARNVADEMILEYQKTLKESPPKQVPMSAKQRPIQQRRPVQQRPVQQVSGRRQAGAVYARSGRANTRGVDPSNRLSQSSNGAIGRSSISPNDRNPATVSMATLRERHRQLAGSQQPAHQAQTTPSGQPAFGRAPNQPFPQGSQLGLPSSR